MSFRRGFVLLFLGFLLCGMSVLAQSPKMGKVKGRVFDEAYNLLDEVKVTIKAQGRVTLTDEEGEYTMDLPVGKHLIQYFKQGFSLSKEEVIIRPGATENVNVKMLPKSYELETEEINAENYKGLQDPDRGFTQLIPIKPEKLTEITTMKSDLTNRLATMGGGVVSNNEFSSQYRVRGGNFDENLIYVNDIEIYRPFLIRSGQQEGLGFVNPNLAREIGFSSGGFQAKYGDKMSSSLDVIYKEPRNFHGSAEIGILNVNVHVEGSIAKKDKEEDEEEAMRKAKDEIPYTKGRLSYLVGARRFTPSYAFNSLDTQGEYRPSFHDVQGMLTFNPRQKIKTVSVRERKDGSLDTLYFNQNRLKFSVFFNLANNNYNFVPTSRETSFGTIQNVFRLRVAFQGQELTRYTTGLGAFMVEHRPSVRLRMKYIFTGFRTSESELFEIEGGYFLSDVNTNFGSEGYNETVFDRGIGTFYQHGRNFLNATVYSAEQKGDWFPDRQYRHKISWGLRAQRQLINDQLQEWYGIDSSGYFKLQESFRSEQEVNSTLVKFYVQDHWKISKDNSKRLIFGSRVIYNGLNQDLLFAPRIQFIIDPSSAKKKIAKELMDESLYTRSRSRNYQLRFAAGIYHQPLFYREMRALNGTINTDRTAQTSYHLIAGGDYLFKIWNRPFKLYGEAYFKYMENLIPYEVDNVRIRYYPFNFSEGYAYGIDTRVTGEFIKGIDSWFSLGLLKTSENILELDDQGFVPRPSDQRLTMGMYFQDELPINPTYKVHINFVYGSGLRFGPPRNIYGRTTFSAPSYQRVDLGFSKLILINTREELDEKKFGLESLWISAEIFNLFQRSNTVSYVWIKDVFNNVFAVPNFLSARLLNIRLIARF